MEKGLKINSKPLWYSRKYPFILISIVPFVDYMKNEDGNVPNPVLLELNMKGYRVNGSEETPEEWNNSEFCNRDWQIKIFGNIPPERIKISKMTLKRAEKMCDDWDKKFPE